MYEVVTDDEVARQVGALPDELLTYYLQAFDLLELTPWNGEPYNDAKPDGAMRKLLFGPAVRPRSSTLSSSTTAALTCFACIG